MELNILNKVNSPSDVKKLNNEELNILAQEIRYPQSISILQFSSVCMFGIWDLTEYINKLL